MTIDAPENPQPVPPLPEGGHDNPWRLRDFKLLWVGRVIAVLAIRPSA